MKDADKMMVSFDTCINIAKTYRDTLKGTIAFMCEKIKELENKTPLEDTSEYYKKSEVDNLLKAYEDRIKALEKKCANIE